MGIPAANPLFIQWRVVDDAAEAPDQWRGDYQGTYFVSETYDVRFLEEHDLKKGNLYKLINQTKDWQQQQRYQSKFAPFNGATTTPSKETSMAMIPPHTSTPTLT